MDFLVARAETHFWEEPVISGTKGSGTIFFGGCSLRCVFCQNYQISHMIKALPVNGNQLVYLMQALEDCGAHNINLVTPSHYARPLARVLEMAKRAIKIPIVYNSSGYDKVEDLRRLDGLIDIYLPDLKYVSSHYAQTYSKRPDYFELASAAIKEMRRQQPIDIIKDIKDSQDNETKNSLMEKGVIVRHLILPSLASESIKALEFLASLDKSIHISLMAQYFPCGNLEAFPEINRRLSKAEYERVLAAFFKLGLENGFTQDLDSAIEDYVPDFDLDILSEKILYAEKRFG